MACLKQAREMKMKIEDIIKRLRNLSVLSANHVWMVCRSGEYNIINSEKIRTEIKKFKKATQIIWNKKLFILDDNVMLSKLEAEALIQVLNLLGNSKASKRFKKMEFYYQDGVHSVFVLFKDYIGVIAPIVEVKTPIVEMWK